ncbi:MAG: hypothetical protein ACREBA_09000, partial [Nitrosotalea sp.]
SMAGIIESTIAAYNKFIDEQKKEKGKLTFSLYEFNNTYPIMHNWQLLPSNPSEDKPSRMLMIHEFVDIKEIPPLTDKTYRPFTNTPLCDVVASAIDKTGELLNNIPEAIRPGKVLFVILTDGYENSSVIHNRETVKVKVEHQTQKYNWAFTFLGANMDAVAEGALYGITRNSSMTFNTVKMGETIGLMSATVSNYRSAAVGAAYAYDDKDREKVV